MKSVSRRSTPCKNPVCGNTLFTAEYDYSEVVQVGFDRPKPVWKCTNCPWTQKRLTRNRKTNNQKAHEFWREIKAEWKETDAALDKIVEEKRNPSGCLIAHSSTWNHHLTQLLTLSKPSAFDLRYHSTNAREDLERAKQFVKEKNENN